MIEWYPYRFKTEEEFIKEFGIGWRNIIHWNDSGYMDYLFGRYYPFDIDIYKCALPKIKNLNLSGYCGLEHWVIFRCMLTPSKIIIPTYKPKKKIERTL